jgi:1A family penicillin-binding protein
MRFFSFLILFFLTIIPVFSQDLPPINLEFSSYSVTEDGAILGYFGDKYRIDVKSTGYVSHPFFDCLIATEDRDFYNHDGVSIKGLIRGLWNTLKGNTQGGSTITMQLARNLFLSNERTISRKLTEMDLARKLENKYSKNQILLLYINTVYFGHGAYGIYAASQTYFNKPPNKLSLPECAVLVGLLQSPTLYDPSKHPDKLLARRNEVMYNLVQVNKISEKEFKKYKNTKLNLALNRLNGKSFNEYVRVEAENILKQKGLKLYNSQLKIYTTLDSKIQESAEDAVKYQYNRFTGYMKNAQIGLISVEPGTGYIKAMVGCNPTTAPGGLNHATQIKRQAGSAFKPFLYGALLDEGYTLASPLEDKPITIDKGKPYEWSPENSSGTFSNRSITMESALQNSINAAAAYAISNLTSVDSVVEFAERMGVNSNIPHVPSIALGTANVSPLELANANAVYASGGYYAQPVCITKIEDKDGRIIYNSNIKKQLVLSPQTAYLLTYGLQNVVDGGTAKVIRQYYKGSAAGKTGTTQNSTDAWFAGFTPELSTTIWVGFDDAKTKLSGGFQYGGSASAPIWGKMMGEIAAKYKSFGKMNFNRPENIQDMQVCPESGELAVKECPEKITVPVNIEKMPPNCSIHLRNSTRELEMRGAF